MSWPMAPLKRLVDPTRPITYGIVQAGPDTPGGIPYIRPVDMTQYDGVPDAKRLQRTTHEIAQSYRRSTVAAGDIVVSIGPSYGKTMVVPSILAGANLTQGTARVAPEKNVSTRYLYWALQSAVAKQFWDSSVGGATFRALNLEPLGRTPVPLAPLAEQRRIADFLDAETARMSTLRDSLRQFDHDVRERERAVLADQLNAGARSVRAGLPPSWQWTPLMHLTDPLRQIMYGIVLPGPNVADGVPIVKGGDVAANRLSLQSLNRTTREIEAGYARSRLKGGDLVIAIRGSVGEVAVVPDELTGANLTQDAARISIERSVHARWLRLVLESPLVIHQIQQRVTGATIKGINIWDLKRVLVPTPDRETQAALATTAGRAIQTHEDLRSRVAQHDRLLAERRQALITAAVTGQFDVFTASGRNVTDGVPN
ncbi:restriction endonuclease subunit S [Streptomyces sp. NPDC002922]|uniref:restriction endonuclease subunit S n=1 Tax=Streptomyces sp. NPDC002922 TaxID=3154439 RepID=UPI0033ADDA17